MGTSMNLKEASAQYIKHLEETGQKPSTVGTARRTLDLLIADMSEAKEVGKILPVHVASFFKSEAATMQPGKGGPKPRAAASVLQIRRIVRSALVWWVEQGYAETVALPKEERRYLEPRTSRKPTAEPAAETTEAQPEPTAETTEAAAEPVAPAAPVEPATDAEPDERQYVPCHKTHQRRAVELCQKKGCLSKAAAAKCRHWQQWLAEGKV